MMNRAIWRRQYLQSNARLLTMDSIAIDPFRCYRSSDAGRAATRGESADGIALGPSAGARPPARTRLRATAPGRSPVREGRSRSGSRLSARAGRGGRDFLLLQLHHLRGVGQLPGEKEEDQQGEDNEGLDKGEGQDHDRLKLGDKLRLAGHPLERRGGRLALSEGRGEDRNRNAESDGKRKRHEVIHRTLILSRTVRSSRVSSRQGRRRPSCVKSR